MVDVSWFFNGRIAFFHLLDPTLHQNAPQSRGHMAPCTLSQLSDPDLLASKGRQFLVFRRSFSPHAVTFQHSNACVFVQLISINSSVS